MKTYHVAVLPALFLFACGSPSGGGEKIDDQSVARESSACYLYENGKDSIRLQLSSVGDKVSGELTYDWFEKDGNTGTVSGEKKGDTLLLDYIFASEGTESIREEVFLKRNGAYEIGYGDMEEKGDKQVFKNRSKLRFGDLVLKEVPCAK